MNLLNCNPQVDEAFISFAEEPIGTASLAQVHKATLKDGRDVAIKVQHPKVKDYSDVDMNTIEVDWIDCFTWSIDWSIDWFQI